MVETNVAGTNNSKCGIY